MSILQHQHQLNILKLKCVLKVKLLIVMVSVEMFRVTLKAVLRAKLLIAMVSVDLLRVALTQMLDIILPVVQTKSRHHKAVTLAQEVKYEIQLSHHASIGPTSLETSCNYPKFIMMKMNLKKKIKKKLKRNLKLFSLEIIE